MYTITSTQAGRYLVLFNDVLICDTDDKRLAESFLFDGEAELEELEYATQDE